MILPYHSRKYFLNENFFTKWSKNMAYVLGFWYADGYMRREKSYRVVFSSKDSEHLELIKKVLNSSSPVKRDSARKGAPNDSFFLSLYSKNLFNDLQKLGGIRNKSLIMKFPKIPYEFLPDFIRGYFDGDGSVHYIKYRHTKNKKIYTNIRSNFTSGSKIFLESVRNLLDKRLGLYHKKICQYGIHQFKLGYSEQDTKKLLNYMYYPNHGISLARKACFLAKIVEKYK